MENVTKAEDIIKALDTEFNGRNPLNELKEQLETMDKEDLIKMVLVSANKIGTALKGRDYENGLDALMYLNRGADILLSAFGIAEMDNTSNIAYN